MDYALLRQEGIRQLERMAGQAWTDFNAHDPGITILEQLCYALTDLAYRCNYEIPDLLASEGTPAYDSLYSPAQILTSHPVTLNDLRKLVIDVDGVKNAWIEPVESPKPAMFYDSSDHSLSLEAAPHRRPVPLRGIYRVMIEAEADGNRHDDDVKHEVTRQLQAHRNLCEDFDPPTILPQQRITVKAKIEVGAVADPARLLAEIYHDLARAITPRIRFYSLAERLAQGKSIDDIMDGPALQHGFIDTDELEGSERKPGLRTSDLLQVIMKVDGVRVVHDINLSSGGTTEPWYLELYPEKTPALDTSSFDAISLVRNGAPVKADLGRVKTIFDDLQQADRPRLLDDTERDIPLPVGRDRAVGNYSSFQHQFPATYGIGAMGLPESATAERKAQAKQLKAYLLLFDQLLANEFAQLAHVKDLFSFDLSPITYFSQSIDDRTLGLDDIWTTKGPSLSQNSMPDYARKHRFLNHLLARYAEEFTDFRLLLIKVKCQFLQEYRELGAARGKAFDVTQPSWDTSNVCGLDQRISRKLGLPTYIRRELKDLKEDDEGGFHLVEHILLRPREADTTPDAKGEGWQAGALSEFSPTQEGLLSRDPYSLQLTFIFPGWITWFKENEVRDFIRQTVREETPAHLTIYLQWLTKTEMGAFEAAFKGWLDGYGTWPALARTAGADTAVERDRINAIRAARDRLIDLLHMGTPYPLRDLQLDYPPMVPQDEPAIITIIGGQAGVAYSLCDEDGNPVSDVDATTPASGDSSKNLTLTTPGLKQDLSYTILASRKATAGGVELLTPLDTYLSHSISLKMGIQKDLSVTFVSAGNETSSQITIDYDSQVSVQIKKSQAGISYVLVKDHPETESEGPPLSDPAQGNPAENIELQSNAEFLEDTDIRIMAYRTGDEKVMAYLDNTLSVKVRPNPAVAVVVDPSVVDYEGSVTLTLTNAQDSADYQLFMRELVPADYSLLVTADPAKVVEQITDRTRETMQKAGSFTGTGKARSITIESMIEDTLCIVQATKQVNQESLQLNQAVVVLVRPDPALQVGMLQSPVKVNSIGTVTVSGTQQGVSYQLLVGDRPINLPGYHYDDRGVETSRIEVDFVVEAPAVPDAYQTLLLPTERITVKTEFHVQATKIRTGLTAALTETATIIPLS